jgi:hypothetical protein
VTGKGKSGAAGAMRRRSGVVIWKVVTVTRYQSPDEERFLAPLRFARNDIGRHRAKMGRSMLRPYKVRRGRAEAGFDR